MRADPLPLDPGAGAASGMAAAVEEAGPLLPLRDEEQLDLLAPPGVRVTREIVEQLPRGRGRPRGASNKRTVAVRDYLLSRYRHPLETLAAFQAASVDKLAAELGCKPVEAAQLIINAADKLAPYMEGKMPVAVDLNVRGDMVLAIEGLNAVREEGGELQNLSFIGGDLIEANFEEDQALGDGETEASE
jgi:hypothetical protein